MRPDQPDRNPPPPGEERPDRSTLPFEGEPPAADRFTTVGEELRRERELREITLQEISEDTKISIRNLKGIEDNEFDRLPGGIYTKNFIRAYCRYLGINEEKMVNHYLYQTSPRKEPSQRRDEGAKERKRQHRLVGILLIMVVCVIGMVGLIWAVLSHPEWFGFAEHAVPSAPPPAAAAARGPAEQIVFHFRAKDDTWIQVSVDGEPRMVRALKRGEHFPVSANREIVLGVENAAALEWSINGKQAIPLGADGEVVTDFAVRHDNWRSLLRAEE